MSIRESYTIECDDSHCREWLWHWHPTLEAALQAAAERHWREVIGDDGDHRWYCPECAARRAAR